MAKEGFGSIDSLYQNMSAGKFYTYLSASSTEDMMSQLRKIKYPYLVVGSYGMNGRHYLFLRFMREVNKER